MGLIFNPRPPKKWWDKAYRSVKKAYSRATKRHGRITSKRRLSALTASIWWGLPQATRDRLVHYYDRMKANPRPVKDYSAVNEHQYARRWDGNTKGLVKMVSMSDARASYYDGQTGAVIMLDPNDLDHMLIFHGDAMWESLFDKHAVQILDNIRKGADFPDVENPLGHQGPFIIPNPRPPKAWWDYTCRQIKKRSPWLSDDSVHRIAGRLWQQQSARTTVRR